MSQIKSSTLKIKNLREHAYTVIKGKIINCKLPPGELINEKELIKEIGTSRTPIREALNRLELEKLIKIIPRKGIFVSDITVRDIMEIYQVRETIDPLVVSLTTHIIPEERLSFFKSEFKNKNATDFYGLIRLDHEFHNYIAQLCNNSYLLQLIENIYSQNQRIRILSSKLPERLEETIKEHLNIIDCISERDKDKAAEAMRQHILNSRDAAFKLNYQSLQNE